MHNPDTDLEKTTVINIIIPKGNIKPQDIPEVGSGPKFTKVRKRKHKRRVFVRSNISKVTLDRRALIFSTREVKLIFDIFALLVSSIPHVNVYNVWTYVYVCVYELS
jgi:hypothetical protein